MKILPEDKRKEALMAFQDNLFGIIKNPLENYESIVSYTTQCIDNEEGIYVIEINLKEKIYIAELLSGKNKIENEIDKIEEAWDPFMFIVKIKNVD